jgi:selenocysteine lyase/cysteine desulfurase
MLFDVPGSLAPRSDFPALAHVVYLDTAGDGLVPAPVTEAGEAFRRASGVGLPGASELRADAYERPRDAVARLLGADRDEIAVTTSASEAFGQVAWGVRPRPGANVVSIDLDFPTVTYPWLRMHRELDLELRLVPALADPGPVSIDAIAELVDERTAAISVSHVQYATGQRLDLAELAALAHEHGALLMVDAGQSAGAVPIDVRAAEVDVLVGHGGKWLCAETGAGFCYLRRELIERVEPVLAGWRSTEVPYDLDATRVLLAASARRLEVSSSSYAARFLLAASIDYLLGLSLDRILAHDLKLGGALIEGLDALGAEILTPRSATDRAGIVATRLPRIDAETAVRRLREHGVVASARLGAIRLSLHLYNDESDVARVVDALEAIVASAARHSSAPARAR